MFGPHRTPRSLATRATASSRWATTTLPSQPTLSLLLDALSGAENQEVVREVIGELALRRLWMSNPPCRSRVYRAPAAS